jgi:replicative DNA helicase
VAEKISGSFQENLLTLLCFDDKAAPLIINTIPLELYESSFYREVASAASNFYLEFKKPIAEHLPDVIDHLLNSKDTRKADIYAQIVNNLYDTKDIINREYILKELAKFVRQQQLKLSIKQAVDFVNNGKIDEAEAVLEKAKKNRLTIFDPGTRLTDFEKIFSAFNIADMFIPIGIKELDDLGVAPAPKELFVFIGRSGAGKTWFLIHVAKFCLLQRKKVLHVTLEMSEARVSIRYMQSLFGISKVAGDKKMANFERNESGYLSNVTFDTVNFKHSLRDEDIKKFIMEKKFWKRKPNLFIKEFPTSSLTIQQLNAYMDHLESLYNFIPDVVMIDYPDLMNIDGANLRVDTGQIFKQLRGIAVERNCAVVVPSQTNRVGEDVKLITRRHLAEDFSKVMIADNLITFNQTKKEREDGIARLYVDKGRNDRTGDLILIAQNYGAGQFCTSSIRASMDYDPTTAAMKASS